jgi:hypothetical protein
MTFGPCPNGVARTRSTVTKRPVGTRSKLRVQQPGGPGTLEEGALGPGTDGRSRALRGPRWRTNLGAATADLGPIVLLPAFQMGYFIRSTGHVEPLLLRLDLLGAEDAHQDLGHVAPPSCSPRPRTLERTALAVTGKGRSAWIRAPGSRSPRETWAGPPPACPRAGR